MHTSQYELYLFFTPMLNLTAMASQLDLRVTTHLRQMWPEKCYLSEKKIVQMGIGKHYISS